jgi:hypothetical protein
MAPMPASDLIPIFLEPEPTFTARGLLAPPVPAPKAGRP